MLGFTSSKGMLRSGVAGLCLASLSACPDRAFVVHRPLVELAAEGGGVGSRVEAIEKGLSNSPDAVQVRIENRSDREFYFDPAKARLARLGTAATQDTVVPQVGGVALLPIQGAQIGSGGGGGFAGGLAGAGVGLALAAVVMVPIAVVAVAERIHDEANRHIAPGRSASFTLVLSGVRLDSGESYALLLGDALKAPAGSVPPLPLVAPEVEHRGYGPPGAANTGFVIRTGGGPVLRRGQAAGAIGGFEIGLFEPIGNWSLGGHAIFGAGSLGLEARYRHPLRDGLWIEPSFGYEYYWLIGGDGFFAGHGPRAGIDLLFRVDDSEMPFGYSTRGTAAGLFLHAGPVIGLRGVGAEISSGLSISIF